MSRLVSFFDDFIPARYWRYYLGGTDQYYIYSLLNGFRLGDELGDERYFSDSLGEIGALRSQGPVQDIQMRSGILAPEFFIYWITQRLW